MFKQPLEFLKLNPLALIPILVDGDFVLAESLAIIMVGPPTHDFNFPVSLIYSYLYSIIHVLYVCSIWTISILNTLCYLMTFPKEHSIFRLHILFCRITSLRKKVGPHEKLPWAQSVIRKGFTGDTSLNTIKIYSALEKLLKDHAGRYATGDEIFLGHLSFEIPLILIISLQYVVQDHLEDFNWCCRGKCNPTAHSRAAPLGMNKEMNTDTIVKAKSFLDGDEDQHEKDVFEKNLKALQKIF
ncbi:hypothetical protein Ahy_B03g063819 [Arachis hypogaea]|uniref:GST N-terminal domain-containing protein n=1 Tax=Arachis hypogaea TaxID=3818 RepID=A0A444ZYL0_ARAHY|nr:hypothetical protein Ahy_B03g063819 [Arachis hypogaea]